MNRWAALGARRAARIRNPNLGPKRACVERQQASFGAILRNFHAMRAEVQGVSALLLRRASHPSPPNSTRDSSMAVPPDSRRVWPRGWRSSSATLEVLACVAPFLCYPRLCGWSGFSSTPSRWFALKPCIAADRIPRLHRRRPRLPEAPTMFFATGFDAAQAMGFYAAQSWLRVACYDAPRHGQDDSCFLSSASRSGPVRLHHDVDLPANSGEVDLDAEQFAGSRSDGRRHQRGEPHQRSHRPDRVQSASWIGRQHMEPSAVVAWRRRASNECWRNRCFLGAATAT